MQTEAWKTSKDWVNQNREFWKAGQFEEGGSRDG